MFVLSSGNVKVKFLIILDINVTYPTRNIYVYYFMQTNFLRWSSFHICQISKLLHTVVLDPFVNDENFDSFIYIKVNAGSTLRHYIYLVTFKRMRYIYSYIFWRTLADEKDIHSTIMMLIWITHCTHLFYNVDIYVHALSHIKFLSVCFFVFKHWMFYYLKTIFVFTRQRFRIIQ